MKVRSTDNNHLNTAILDIADHLPEEARACADCHDREGDLPLERLGYPPGRVEEIVGTEAIGMLEGYETFHVFDIDRIRPPRTDEEPEAP